MNGAYGMTGEEGEGRRCAGAIDSGFYWMLTAISREQWKDLEAYFHWFRFGFEGYDVT